MKKISKRKVFGLIIVSFCLIVLGIFLVPSSLANQIPVKEISITSNSLSYGDNIPGSWKITKNAKWISKDKARVTIEVDSIRKISSQYIDLILVLDTSSSMTTDKLEEMKTTTINLITNILEEENNKVSLITFNTTSTIVSDFTNSKEDLVNSIESLTSEGNSNYYQALISIDEVLKDYTKEETRDCVVLFITDGNPDKDTPNEISQYDYLKEEYPYLTIHGIQYTAGDKVLESLKSISDYQYISEEGGLDESLIESLSIPYENFTVTDYIDITHFELESIDKVKTTSGEITLDDNKVIWNISNYKTGSSKKLTIDLTLKNEYIDVKGMYPTNSKFEIDYKINEVKELISTEQTPIIKNYYQVVYDGNAPPDCTIEGIPEEETKMVFDTVEIDKNTPTCKGYEFKGWKINNEEAYQLSSDTFIMPESDVVIRAIWTKASISKSMDGTISIYYPPVIQKVGSSSYGEELWAYKSSITKIVIEPSFNEPLNVVESWDISEANNSSVLAYLVENEVDTESTEETTTTYTAYIQGDGGLIANEDSSYLFYNFNNLEEIYGLEYLDTSNVTAMSLMFERCSSLLEINLTTFDTSKVTKMNSMFYGCSKLINLDLVNFNTSNVIQMEFMFQNCSSLTNLDLTGFDTSQVTNMKNMFFSCTSLQTLDIKNFVTSNVIDMSNMFDGNGSLLALDVSNFDTSKVTTMENMFYGCSSLKNLDVSKFNTSEVTIMKLMFFSCNSLTSLDVSGFDTSNVTDMSYMFDGNSNLLSLDVSNFDTSKVTTMENMFYGCTSLPTLDVGGFNTSRVTTMKYMFYHCNSLNSLDVSSFDTSSVINMNGMFYHCSILTSLDVSKFDTSNVTDMSYMFDGNSNLLSLDLSNFDTSKVIGMQSLFYGCSGLTTLNLSNFDTSNVTDMHTMFYGCGGLTTLDLSRFNTSKVTNMINMFTSCSNLKELNLSNFNTSNVTSMNWMFSGCLSLKKIILGSNFSFLGSGSCTDSYLPTPSSSYITGADGYWYNVDTGVGYLPTEIPNNTAATYTAIKPQVSESTEVYTISFSGVANDIKASIIDESGNILSDNVTTAVPGDIVMLSYISSETQIDSFELNGMSMEGNTFVMPETNVDITLGDFEVYTISFSGVANDIKASIIDESGNILSDNVTTAVPGDIVMLSYISSETQIDSFELNGMSMEGNTFVMPETDVDITLGYF